MTTIEDVLVHRRSLPLVRPFVTAVRTAHAVEAVLVEVRDSEGRSGWGEAAVSWRVTGESPESVSAAVLGPIRDALLGAAADDPTSSGVRIEAAVVRNNSARAAVESAVFDLAARAAGQPLWRYLGGASARVRTDMTLSALSPTSRIDDLVAVASDHVAAGFTTLKIKAGGGGDDRAALMAVRDAAGPDVVLRVDANQGWTPQEAVAAITAWEEAGLGVELVEQPVHRDDLEGMAFVAKRVSTPIMADESVWNRRNLHELLTHEAGSLVNIKLAKTGGLVEALALARTAADNGIGVIVGCMSESHVGIAAAAALASALDADELSFGGVHDLDAGLWLRSSPVVGGATYHGEVIDLLDQPGTGIGGIAQTLE